MVPAIATGSIRTLEARDASSLSVGLDALVRYIYLLAKVLRQSDVSRPRHENRGTETGGPQCARPVSEKTEAVIERGLIDLRTLIVRRLRSGALFP